VLGTPALFATAYGNVGSSIYYALGVTAAFALGLTPLVFVAAGVIFAATAATYAEGTVRYPEAGGSSSFARHGFNELVSFGAAWSQMLVYVATVAISAFFVPHYLSVFWEPLRENPWDVVGGAVVVVLLVALNIVGVQEAARVNILLAVVDFATQALLVIIGFVLVFSPEVLRSNIHWGVAPTWRDFAIAIPVAMLAYTGVETVSNLAEEVRDPPRNVPNAYKLIAAAVFAIYFTLPLVALSALPVYQQEDGDWVTLLGLPPEEGGFTNDPVLGVVKNLGLSGSLLNGLEIYVGVLAATILFIATNAGVIGASRITYAMASYRQLPEVFRRLHPRFRTPWLALVFFAGIIPLLTILPGQTDFLGTMYAFGATLSFTVAHASLVAIRYRYRDEETPYRARPNLRARGVDWPLFAILGGIGTLIAWLVIVVQEPTTRWAGIGWLVVGFVAYAVYRRRFVVEPMARTVHAPAFVLGPGLEIEYRTILVPV
jgi:basic amino acid/polyamine antiporter, APA family